MKNKKTNLNKILSLLFSLVVLCGCSKTKSQIESIEQLKNGSYIIGSPNLTYCQEQAPTIFPNASSYLSFDSMPAAYLALQQEKIDALIVDETTARVDINNGVEGVKILEGTVGEGNSIVVGISKESKNINKSTIDSILEELFNNGIIDDMKSRWLMTANYEMPEIDYPTSSDVTLKIATSGNVEPFSFYRFGELTGFDVELSRRIAKKLNVNLSFEVNTSYNSIIASTVSGKTDLLIANLYETEERKEQMPLSIPYITTSACVVVKDYSTYKGYTTLEELKNKRIGYDSTSTQFTTQLNKYLPDSQKLTFDNSSDSVLALQNNRIDAFITDLPNAKYIEKTTTGLRILPEYLDYDEYGFLFKKGSYLVEEFNNIILDFKERNILKDLDDKWFNNLDQPNKEIFISSGHDKTLKAITTALLPPMSYLDKNNNIIGFEAELLAMICDKLGYNLEILPAVSNSGSVITSIESGKADIAFNVLSITEERKKEFDFSIPYYIGAAVLLVKNGEVNNDNFFEKLASSFEKTFIIEQRWKMILDGMFMTLIISLASGILGLLTGFGLCMIKRGKNKPLGKIAKAITKIIQGTPIVVLLMIFYYVIFGKIDISAVIVAIIAFGINFGVAASEIMRSGFDTVDKGQEEGAKAMGYSKNQTFWKIIFPQAAKKFIPVLRGEFISMVKTTSIAGYISVAELTRVGDIIRSKTMEAFFPLIVIALIYFGLAELLTLSLSLLEKKLDSKNNPFKLKGVKEHE